MTTLTADQATRVRAVLGDLRVPVFVVPHGVRADAPPPTGPGTPDESRGPSADGDLPIPVPYVLHVAGLRAEKGFPGVFATADAIRAACPDVAYVLVGPGIDPKLEPLASAFFAERPWAVRLGPRPRDAVLALVRGALCTLHASGVEGLSNALLESLALGVVPVARNIPASRAAIRDAETGHLYDTDAAAAAAVLRLRNDPVHRATLSAAARADAATRFAPDEEIRGYLRAYAAAVRR